MLSSCPGARSIKELVPSDVRCCACGTEVEIWSDEFRVRCPECGEWVMGAQGPTCLDWCAMAQECVGKATFDAYRRTRESQN